MSKAPVISLGGVALWRRTQEEFHYDFKRFIFTLLRGGYRKPHRRQVLHDVDLDVSSGEKVGIIGANGSGKSTLLKVICGILRPTTGHVKVTGSIAPLIELGAGFDPELSLIDNVVYYGMLLGVQRRTMREHLDAILDFAELQEYRTEPVKTLSSGMTARLGFAIATEFRPDILILDEVLSVGDEAFKRKCKERVDTLWDEDSTILVVSHDLDFIGRSCDRTIWLDKGTVMFDGPAYEAVLRYKLAVEENRLPAGASEPPMLLLCASRSDSTHGDRLYVYVAGRKCLIVDDASLAQHGLDANEALRIADDVLDRIPDGEPLESSTSVAIR